MWAANTVPFAIEKKLYPKTGKAADFDFSATFDPITVVGARLCEARVWDVFRKVAEPSFEAQYLDYARGKNLSNRMPLFVKAVKPVHAGAAAAAGAGAGRRRACRRAAGHLGGEARGQLPG